MSSIEENGGVRQRKRSKSLTDDNHYFELVRLSQPDRPLHLRRDSLFSPSSGFNNFRGFFNLAIILLVLATLRVALENLIKYGILINYYQILHLFFGDTSIWPTIVSCALLHLFVLASYLIEAKVVGQQLSPRSATRLVVVNLTLVLLWPVVSVYSVDIHPVSASLSSLLYSILFLKLFSYHHVNHWCREDLRQRAQQRRNSEEVCVDKLPSGYVSSTLVQYPENVTIKNILYFFYAPTLCYELNFPYSDRIRIKFLLKRLFEVVFLFQLNLALMQQWMVPTINNSLRPLQEMDYFRMLERLLKLAIPNHIVWLIWFYLYFHSMLNLIAELLRFGDRQFYRDWWNAESIQYFWKNWNIPVHHWCVRHLYVPLLKRGHPKWLVTSVVFIVSALFHEYLISVPLKLFEYWAFAGMALQLPFAVILTKYFNGPLANVFVWFTLIIGQPLCILACYHDYYVIHHAIY